VNRKDIREAYRIAQKSVNTDNRRFVVATITYDKVVGIGMAECSPKDKFVGKIGRDLALERAKLSFVRAARSAKFNRRPSIVAIIWDRLCSFVK